MILEMVYIGKYWEYPYNLVPLLGIFASTDRAKSACQNYHNMQNPEARRLLWMEIGDVLKAPTANGAYYEITPIEVDKELEIR